MVCRLNYRSVQTPRQSLPASPTPSPHRRRTSQYEALNVNSEHNEDVALKLQDGNCRRGKWRTKLQGCKMKASVGSIDLLNIKNACRPTTQPRAFIFGMQRVCGSAGDFRRFKALTYIYAHAIFSHRYIISKFCESSIHCQT